MSQNTPTIEDIARETRLSASAVSYALRGKPYVSAETQKRVLAVAERLGYIPNGQARNSFRVPLTIT